ncbi:PD-(D/E)XK motif protein [Pseudomonas fragi]|nr:PD-(D/E)XK motif protein [Pseudomonas sp. GC01]
MLTSKFSNLPRAKSTEDFIALSLSTRRKDFLTKGVDGEPIFLLHDSSPKKYVPGIQYRYINAQFHSTCRIKTNEDSLQDQFAVIACDSEVPELYELFINCFSAAIESLPSKAVTKQLESSIQDLLALFRDMSRPNRREASGLWAELFIIERSENTPKILSYWHDDPYDRYDFSWKNAYLEVKSTTQPTRIHDFSVDQLCVPVNAVGYVASLLMLPLGSGIGIMDIARKIDNSISGFPLLRKKLWSNIAKALGSDFSEKIDRRFDLAFSEQNFMLYSMSDIPAFKNPIDTRISSIRYKASLDTTSSSLPQPTLDFVSEILRTSSASERQADQVT